MISWPNFEAAAKGCGPSWDEMQARRFARTLADIRAATSGDDFLSPTMLRTLAEIQTRPEMGNK